MINGEKLVACSIEPKRHLMTVYVLPQMKASHLNWLVAGIGGYTAVFEFR